MKIRDVDGIEVSAGDIVHFAYGIPPVGVDAAVIDRGGTLIALTPGHKPSECAVKDLKKHVGEFWVEKKQS